MPNKNKRRREDVVDNNTRKDVEVGGGESDNSEEDDGDAGSSVMDEFFSSRPHPLLIPHIIELVFDYLFLPQINRNIPDVRSARLVSRTWNVIATKLYRKNSEDLVFGERHGSDSKRMRKFLRDMHGSFDNPIETYRFDPGFFTQKNELLFKNFLYSSTQWIVTLKMWFDNQSDLRFRKRCYSSLKLDCLNYLFFGCVNYRGTCSAERMELTYALDALLVAATRLKKLCFSFPPKDIKSQQAMIKRFGDLVSSKCPKSVTNLKLEMKLTDAQVDALKEVGLSLDVLHCDFRGSVLSSDVLFNLFQQQESSLQEIRLLDSEIKYAYELKFPRFKKLTVLEIQGGSISKFSFKDNFPVLERLLLFGWENEKTNNLMLQSTTPCTTLTSLELPYKIHDKNIISLATKCFPNLKKLEITPTQEGMGVLASVFANLIQLEELEITFPFIIDVEMNVDPVFTGMSLDDREFLSQCTVPGTLQTVNYSYLQASPSIANLSKLKRLTILDHSNEIRLTDLAAYFGLLRLASLEVLEMSRFNISSEIFQALKEKVHLCENYDSSDSCSDATFSSDSSCDLDQLEFNISEEDETL